MKIGAFSFTGNLVFSYLDMDTSFSPKCVANPNCTCHMVLSSNKKCGILFSYTPCFSRKVVLDCSFTYKLLYASAHVPGPADEEAAKDSG